MGYSLDKPFDPVLLYCLGVDAPAVLDNLQAACPDSTKAVVYKHNYAYSSPHSIDLINTYARSFTLWKSGLPRMAPVAL